MPAGRYDAAAQSPWGKAKGTTGGALCSRPCAWRRPRRKIPPTGQKILSLSEEPLYRPKFAVVEWIEGLKERFSSPEEQDGIDKAAAG